MQDAPQASSQQPTAVADWLRRVGERRIANIDSLLADDIVLHSPVVARPLRGREQVTLYLSGVFKVFFRPGFRYVRQIVGNQHAALEFEVEVEGIGVNGIDLITWNAAGQITELKVMLRPINAINAIHQKMESLLKARQQSS